MAKPNQLFLLADHIKLSLLERRRADPLRDANSEGPGAQEAQNSRIARSLDQFREGLAGLEAEAKRLEENGDQSDALAITDAIPALKQQLDGMTSAFYGFVPPDSVATLTSPNDPSLSPDFAHAASRQGLKTSIRAGPDHQHQQHQQHKTVRFRDSPRATNQDPDLEANQRELFGPRYRDEPNSEPGHADVARGMENTQIHAYHEQVLADQDAQLDALGESIGRQRELSMRIGDELDEHVVMLDEMDEAVDRQQGRLDRAGRQLGRIARGEASGAEWRGMVVIVVLIVILVMLIAVLK